jgi:glucose-1-phosphate adenylyltransferase
VPELVTDRLMASIPFASRYRLIDFLLSSMVNCGIDNVSIIVKKNYHSLMDHLGAGREWDLTRKKGGLNIVPPFAQRTINLYNMRVEALASIINFLDHQKEKYVVMADTNIAVNFDFKSMLQQHIDSGADVTVAYTKEPIPNAMSTAKRMASRMFP